MSVGSKSADRNERIGLMRRMSGAMLLGVALSVGSTAQAQSGPSDYTHATRYDAGRRVTGTIAPDPDAAGPLRFAALRNTYDAAGRLVRVETGQLQNWQPEGSAPANWPGFSVFKQMDTTYDAIGRKTATRVSGGGTLHAVTQYSYNSQGLLECTAVRMNPGAFGSLPGSACSLGAEGSHGPDRIERNEYDAAGQLTKVIRAYGTSVQQDYVTYTYSPNGKRTSVRDANGNLAQLTWDGFDRQARWIFPSKTNVGSVDGSDYEAYDYDANGNRTSLRRRDGRTLTFSYDAMNRMTAKFVPDGCAPIQAGGCAPVDTTRDVYYGYDLRGLQIYARYDSTSGEGVINSYTGFGEIASSTTTMAGQSRTLGFQYDANSNRTRIVHPNGSAFTQSYDGLDRPTLTVEPGGVAIASVVWTARGVPGAVSKVGAVTNYDYDTIDRLISLNHSMAANSVTTTFGFNPDSQVVSQSRNNDAYAFTAHYNIDRVYGVNGLNQYTAAGPAMFQYDANGNVISDGARNYTYDAENRLVAASNGTSLRYDPLGRLWQIASGSGTSRFVYDGDQLTAEYNTSGALLRSYVHGVGDDDPMTWYEGAGLGDRRSLMADHQGSVVAVINASGNPIGINAYDEYGIPKPANLGRFQYTGQAWLSELGMYHYKARVYSPTLGRFLQTDPIGYDDQINLYAYVANDPVNGRDPDGKQSVPMIGSNYDTDSQIRAACGGNSSCEQQARKDAAEVAITGLSFAPIGGVAIKGVEWGVRGFQAWRAERLAANLANAQAAWNGAVKGSTFARAGDVGKVIGWGTKPGAALARLGEITKSEVAAMRDNGLTRNLAEKARDLYKAVDASVKDNAVASERLKLMNEILKKW